MVMCCHDYLTVRVHRVHAVTAEIVPAVANLWTKPMRLSHKPSCRQHVDYTHHCLLMHLLLLLLSLGRFNKLHVILNLRQGPCWCLNMISAWRALLKHSSYLAEAFSIFVHAVTLVIISCIGDDYTNVSCTNKMKFDVKLLYNLYSLSGLKLITDSVKSRLTNLMV